MERGCGFVAPISLSRFIECRVQFRILKPDALVEYANQIPGFPNEVDWLGLDCLHRTPPADVLLEGLFDVTHFAHILRRQSLQALILAPEQFRIQPLIFETQVKLHLYCKSGEQNANRVCILAYLHLAKHTGKLIGAFQDFIMLLAKAVSTSHVLSVPITFIGRLQANFSGMLCDRFREKWRTSSSSRSRLPSFSQSAA